MQNSSTKTDLLLPALLVESSYSTALAPGRWGPDSVWLLNHPSYPPNPPTRLFADELTLEVGETTLRCLHLPGHTKPQTAVLLAAEGVVYTGDNIFSRCKSFIQEADPWEWLAAPLSVGQRAAGPSRQPNKSTKFVYYPSWTDVTQNKGSRDDNLESYCWWSRSRSGRHRPVGMGYRSARETRIASAMFPHRHNARMRGPSGPRLCADPS